MGLQPVGRMRAQYLAGGGASRRWFGNLHSNRQRAHRGELGRRSKFGDFQAIRGNRSGGRRDGARKTRRRTTATDGNVRRAAAIAALSGRRGKS